MINRTRISEQSQLNPGVEMTYLVTKNGHPDWLPATELDMVTQDKLTAGLDKKQDKLNDTQFRAINSGITSDLVARIDAMTSAYNVPALSKDASLTDVIESINAILYSLKNAGIMENEKEKI